MQLKIFSGRIFFIVFFWGLILFATTFIYIKSSHSSWIFTKTKDTLAEEKRGLPVRLKIPKIDLDASVEYVGLTRDGAMDVPLNIDNVAWYKLWTSPGKKGSAVIAGHYGAINGKIPAFENLDTLREGDKIYILTNWGGTLSFVVRQIKKYKWDANAPEVFHSDDGKSHLNLITCDGAWDARIKMYPQRLVIFTDQE